MRTVKNFVSWSQGGYGYSRTDYWQLQGGEFVVCLYFYFLLVPSGFKLNVYCYYSVSKPSQAKQNMETAHARTTNTTSSCQVGRPHKRIKGSWYSRLKHKIITVAVKNIYWYWSKYRPLRNSITHFDVQTGCIIYKSNKYLFNKYKSNKLQNTFSNHRRL